MKIGTINYATRSGLGILTKEFWENEVINDRFFVLRNELYWGSQVPGCAAQVRHQSF